MATLSEIPPLEADRSASFASRHARSIPQAKRFPRALRTIALSLFFASVTGLLGVFASLPNLARNTATMSVAAPTVDGDGVRFYPVYSIYQNDQLQTIRVLKPTHPTPGQPHRILFVLPVNPGYDAKSSPWGDGLTQLRLLDVQNRFNLTLIAPSFNYEPWYGDNENDSSRRMESFIIDDLVPFSDAFAKGSVPQRYLLGYSKSGNGALFLILRHPGVFNGAAIWDAPAQLSDIDTTGLASPGALKMNFGNQENFARYSIPSLLASNAAPFRHRKRIWISDDHAVFTAQMEQLNREMTADSVAHTWTQGRSRAHRWDSGWLEAAVDGLMANATLTAPAGNLPPPRTGGLPFGELPSGSTGTTLSLKTDQPATCRYATTPNTAYVDMIGGFEVTGGTQHATSVTGLKDGNTYNFFARCRDSASGAVNLTDYRITFKVAACRLYHPFRALCR
jgi:hypothetical protein